MHLAVVAIGFAAHPAMLKASSPAQQQMADRDAQASSQSMMSDAGKNFMPECLADRRAAPTRKTKR